MWEGWGEGWEMFSFTNISSNMCVLWGVLNYITQLLCDSLIQVHTYMNNCVLNTC